MIKFLYFIFILFGFFGFSQNGPIPHKEKTKQAVINKPFEGIIKFKQETFSDTLNFIYYIKDNYVKLVIEENCSNCESGDEAMIFDLINKTITAIKPSMHMYKDIPIKPYVKGNNSKDFIITQTPRNYKTINGYKCIQWRVKNVKENTEISYWVTKGNFYFFDDLLKLWNRTEKQSRYFLKISNTDGYFPMLSVERNTLREKRMVLKVINIEYKKLDNAIFEIPPDYKEL